MQYEIGELSGVIWKILDEKGTLSLTQLKKSVEATEFMIGAAIGWLAREDKIELLKSGKTIKVSLK